ncbi:FAD-binding monooxygenase [Nitzschia inconspicua]|uniref:FAD-binding monooxygenase n=1 Tax=Nitzschia inconspicua TaxID=303405 RepID=A0A9K3KFY9_9STRA|nr:FAD-binding monooxygenase [Nitzschia inconspicua]
MKICIVGGGLAGLAFAVSLSKAVAEDRDVEISVVEQRDFSSRGATFGLALNGQVALQDICPSLLEELKNIGILLPTGGYMLPWYCVRDGLLEHARRCQNVTIFTNTSVVSATDKGVDDILVTLEETSADGTVNTTTVKMDLLIGADGVHSSVRSLVGAPPAVSSHTKCWRGALNDLPPHLSHVLDIPTGKMIKTESGLFGIFNFNTSMAGFVSWVATSKNLDVMTPFEALEGIEDSNDLTLAQGLLEASTQQEREFFTTLSTIPLNMETGWGGKGRITLIGDAAHALRPASGLGGSLAFEDAVLLTRAITKHMDSDESIDAALREFESLRFVRCQTILEDQTRIAESGYGTAAKSFKWTPEYEKWVFAGPDADLKPPLNMYVGDEENVAEGGAVKRETNHRVLAARPTSSSISLSSSLSSS